MERYTEELKNLDTIAGIYQNMNIPAFVLPPTEERAAPVLTAVLPEEQGEERIVCHSFLDLPEEWAAHINFLQFYTEIDVPEPLEREKLLECVCALNREIPIGRCTPEQTGSSGQTVGLRWVCGLPAEAGVEQDSLLEYLALFDRVSGYTARALEEKAKGNVIL